MITYVDYYSTVTVVHYILHLLAIFSLFHKLDTVPSQPLVEVELGIQPIHVVPHTL